MDAAILKLIGYSLLVLFFFAIIVVAFAVVRINHKPPAIKLDSNPYNVDEWREYRNAYRIINTHFHTLSQSKNIFDAPQFSASTPTYGNKSNTGTGEPCYSPTEGA